MKKKELKNIAKQIALNEMIIMTSKDQKEVNKAMESTMKLSEKISSFEEMEFVDEYVQKIFQQIDKSKNM